MTSAAPTDLRHQTADRPRARTEQWAVGDVLTLGNVCWCIRILNGQHVELEAMNVNNGIWWTTTLGNLPDKEKQ